MKERHQILVYETQTVALVGRLLATEKWFDRANQQESVICRTLLKQEAKRPALQVSNALSLYFSITVTFAGCRRRRWGI